MTRYLDYFLILALLFNIIMSIIKYQPTTEVLTAEIPTWLSIVIQLACIGLIGFKLYKNRNIN